jgi:histidine triad (HIT) family protein
MNLLFRLARTSLGGALVGWAIRNMSFLIPGEPLHETEHLLAFFHPSPSYLTHVLILPKRRYQSLMELDPQHKDFLADLYSCVQTLVRQLELEQSGYRFIVNGGNAQEVQQLHFHLISVEEPLETNKHSDQGEKP